MGTLCMSVITVALLAGSAVGVAGQDETASRPPIPSAGCGTSEVAAGMDLSKQLTVGDADRQWAMQVPDAHNGEEPIPLWIHLHGGQRSEQLAAFRSVDEHGFVAVAPTGSRAKGMGRLSTGWMWGDTDAEIDLTLDNPDTAFIDALIDHLGHELCLDLARVYATGYSDGADAVGVLACAMEDRIAAFAATGGVVDLGEACEQRRPVPLLGMHGRQDENARFEGGFMREVWNTLPISKELGRLAIPDRLTQAAVRNGCGAEPTIEPIVDGVERWRWPCPAGAEIELVLHPGGHTWSLGRTEMHVNDLVWEFFEQHPMPE